MNKHITPIDPRRKYFLLVTLIMGAFLSINFLSAPAMTYTVSVTTDTPPTGAPGELRTAILASNANPPGAGNHNTIVFTTFGAITPVADLPIITQPVLIDGYTAPFSSVNTAPITAANNAVTSVGLVGPGAGVDLPVLNGLVLGAGSDGSIIRGLFIDNFANVLSASITYGAGISIQSNGNQITGNFIGTDGSGFISLPNATGIRVDGNANIIGGVTPDTRNLLSGHYLGGSAGSLRINGVVRITGADTIIQQNTVGLDRTGTTQLMDSARVGIVTIGSGGTTLIGGPSHAANGNVISGQRAGNIVLEAITGAHTIQNNYIGIDVTGIVAVAGNGNGIIVSRSAVDAPQTLIINGNTIAANTHGITLGSSAVSSFPVIGAQIINNIIGLNAAASAAVPNSLDGIWVEFAQNTYIAGNVVSANGTNGIRVGKAKNTTIKSNIIGSNAGGSVVLGNGLNGIQLGMVVAAGVPAFGDVVGGAKPGEGNIITRNGANGIELVSFTREETIIGNSIQNNALNGILLDPYSSRNYIGIFRGAGDLRLVGGISAQGNSNLGPLGTSNLISGNGLDGIRVTRSNFNTISTNFIETNIGNGIELVDSSNNLVGGKDGGSASSSSLPPVLGNTISGNGAAGVAVVQQCGNATDNSILSNSDATNTTNGISLVTL